MASRPGRVTGKAARRKKWYYQRRNQWIAGGVLAAVALAGGISVALDDSSSDAGVKQSPGDKWKDGIVADFSTMSQSALSYLRTMNDWKVKKAKNAEVEAAANLALGQFLDTRDRLVDRTAFEQAPRALADYRDSVQLYIVHARLAKLGVQVPDEDLNRQIQLIMGRLRYVADRLYDLGGDEMAPYTFQNNDVEGFEYARTVDVPSFAGTDLAPGPPLTQARPGGGATREYQKVRPEEPFDTWKAAVEGAKIPSPAEEAKAIRSGSQDELDHLSDQLTAASDALHNAPDPMDERELSTRVQLGLLVQAEAMRTAQVSRLVADKLRPEATEITQVLMLVGNGMWDPRLAPRETDYPATLLTIRPKVAPPPVPEVAPSPSALPSGTPPASTPVPTPAATPAATSTP
jgi:hypothetical protein